MSALEATRAWLRGCPSIDAENRFRANYLGDNATEYSVSQSSVDHRKDVLGKDTATYNMLFSARLPFSAAMAAGLEAADFFDELDQWVRQQDAAREYPELPGYLGTSATPSNAGLVITADANTAIYQIQIRLIFEEE